MAIKQSNDPDPSLGLAEDIQGEFTGTNPVSLSEYYRGGSFVPDIPLNTTISASGAISFSMFYGTQANTPSTGLPIITDDAGVVIPNVYVGRTLYVNVSGISDTDGIQAGSWEVKWTNLTNPTGSEAFVASSDPDVNGVLSITATASAVAEEWQAEVKFLDTPGDETILTSASVTVEVFSPGPQVTIFLDPDDSPNTYQGSILTSSVTYFFNPPGSQTVNWQRLVGTFWQDISGEDNSTYTVTAFNAFNGDQIRLKATETLDLSQIGLGIVEFDGFSNVIGPAENFPATGIVELRAEPETDPLSPGVTLLADASNISDRDGISDYTYTWTRSDIGGGNPVVVQTTGGILTTTDTYTTNLTDDVDKDFSVSVVVTDSIGTAVGDSQFNNVESAIVSNTVTVTNATNFTVTNNNTSVEEGQQTRFTFEVANAIAETYDWEITGSAQVLSQVSNTTGSIGANATTVTATTFDVDISTTIDTEYSSGVDKIGDLTFTVTGSNTGATQSLTIDLNNGNPTAAFLTAPASADEGSSFNITLIGSNIRGDETLRARSLEVGNGGDGGIYTQAEADNNNTALATIVDPIVWTFSEANQRYESTITVNTIEDSSLTSDGILKLIVRSPTLGANLADINIPMNNITNAAPSGDPVLSDIAGNPFNGVYTEDAYVYIGDITDPNGIDNSTWEVRYLGHQISGDPGTVIVDDIVTAWVSATPNGLGVLTEPRNVTLGDYLYGLQGQVRFNDNEGNTSGILETQIFSQALAPAFTSDPYSESGTSIAQTSTTESPADRTAVAKIRFLPSGEVQTTGSVASLPAPDWTTVGTWLDTDVPTGQSYTIDLSNISYPSSTANNPTTLKVNGTTITNSTASATISDTSGVVIEAEVTQTNTANTLILRNWSFDVDVTSTSNNSATDSTSVSLSTTLTRNTALDDVGNPIEVDLGNLPTILLGTSSSTCPPTTEVFAIVGLYDGGTFLEELSTPTGCSSIFGNGGTWKNGYSNADLQISVVATGLDPGLTQSDIVGATSTNILTPNWTNLGNFTGTTPYTFGVSKQKETGNLGFRGATISVSIRLKDAPNTVLDTRSITFTIEAT